MRAMPPKLKGVSTSHLVSVFTQIIYRCDAPSQFASWSEQKCHNQKSKKRTATAALRAVGGEAPQRLAGALECARSRLVSTHGGVLLVGPLGHPLAPLARGTAGRIEAQGQRFDARLILHLAVLRRHTQAALLVNLGTEHFRKVASVGHLAQSLIVVDFVTPCVVHGVRRTPTITRGETTESIKDDHLTDKIRYPTRMTFSLSRWNFLAGRRSCL